MKKLGPNYFGIVKEFILGIILTIVPSYVLFIGWEGLVLEPLYKIGIIIFCVLTYCMILNALLKIFFKRLEIHEDKVVIKSFLKKKVIDNITSVDGISLTGGNTSFFGKQIYYIKNPRNTVKVTSDEFSKLKILGEAFADRKQSNLRVESLLLGKGMTAKAVYLGIDGDELVFTKYAGRYDDGSSVNLRKKSFAQKIMDGYMEKLVETLKKEKEVLKVKKSEISNVEINDLDSTKNKEKIIYNIVIKFDANGKKNNLAYSSRDIERIDFLKNIFKG